MKYLINGKTVTLKASDMIGKGGEAEVYLWDRQAVKIYKTPDHPDCINDPAAGRIAAERVQYMANKIASIIDMDLDPSVVKPMNIVMKDGKFAGYTMEYVPDYDVLYFLSQRSYRDQNPHQPSDVMRMFRSIWKIVESIHDQDAVIGDFNDLNLMFWNGNIRLVDIDSMQFDKYICRMFTARFVDPRLVEERGSSIDFVRGFDRDSDWYAFNVMLFSSLMMTDPFGGVHKPAKISDRIPHYLRAKRRHAVWEKDVVYPRPANPMEILPTSLANHFKHVFSEGKNPRVDWQRVCMDSSWRSCSKCNSEFSAELSVCPRCKMIEPQKAISSATVEATLVSTAKIVYATTHERKLMFIFDDGQGNYYFNNRKLPINFHAKTRGRFRIYKNEWAAGYLNSILIDGVSLHMVDMVDGRTILDANSSHLFAVKQGRLIAFDNVHDALRASDRLIGDVLANRTRFWVDDNNGFGFYPVGRGYMGFRFDARNASNFQDGIIFEMPGTLIDASCTFAICPSHAVSLAWLFAHVKVGAYMRCVIMVVKGDGTIVAQDSFDVDHPDGFARRVRGRAAVGPVCLVPTDEGMIRLAIDNGKIVVAKAFPETKQWIDDDTTLLLGNDGSYAVNSNSIYKLKLS